MSSACIPSFCIYLLYFTAPEWVKKVAIYSMASPGDDQQEVFPSSFT